MAGNFNRRDPDAQIERSYECGRVEVFPGTDRRIPAKCPACGAPTTGDFSRTTVSQLRDAGGLGA